MRPYRSGTKRSDHQLSWYVRLWRYIIHQLLNIGCSECVVYMPQLHSSEYRVKRRGCLMRDFRPEGREEFYKCLHCHSTWGRRKL